MTEQVVQGTCIKLCIKLEHSSAETIQRIQKATAMGNWWLTASSQQHTHSCSRSHAQFFGETSNHPGDSAPPTAQIWHYVTCSFSPNQNRLCKGRNFRPLMRFRKIWWGSWWRLKELCEVPRCLIWRGLRCHCPMYNVSCIFFNQCLYFWYYVVGYLLYRSCMYNNLLRKSFVNSIQ